MKNNKIEILKDVVATASILVKHGREDILDSQKHFVAFLQEIGFTTVRGCPLTQENFRKMVQSFKPSEIEKVMKEFDAARISDLIEIMIDEK